MREGRASGSNRLPDFQTQFGNQALDPGGDSFMEMYLYSSMFSHTLDIFLADGGCIVNE